DGLVTRDTRSGVHLELAESMEWTDETTLEVKLRQGVMFHDGVEMTADDVVFTFKALREGTTYSSNIEDAFDVDGDGYASEAEVAVGVIKVDEYNITFVMANSYNQFFHRTLGVPIIPQHIWQDHLTAGNTVDTLWGTDPDATIATGPFYYAGGENDAFRDLRVFEDHWGKSFTTPSGHKLYPSEVNRIHFKLYPSLDNAVLGMKSGMIDHIPRSLTPGYVSELQSNPNTSVHSISDNGYFYLTFNQKREPMNQLPFRKAVSHCINKTALVEKYMGGLGLEGDSCEPPYWNGWYNNSVIRYPFDLDAARQVLQDAGYTGIDTSLVMPDGRPVPPLVILTPPADYDPIRTKAGELIAKNLRNIGADVVAKPMDFDSLVAKWNAFDYDMHIIGWSLSSDPVDNVFGIFGHESSQNYFSFWSEEHPNPWYNNIGGVSTLADAETQALANQFYDIQQMAEESFDRDEQITYTKWGQGIISKAIPVNVLYYRVHNYAVSTTWNGWLPHCGELLNVYSIGALTRQEETSVGENLTALLNLSEKIPHGTASDGWVVVIDGDGVPVSGADIILSATGITFSPATGTTDVNGIFQFTATGDSHGYVTVQAQADHGAASFTASKVIHVATGMPPTLYLTTIPDSIFLGAGESTNVNLRVVDQNGNPVEGAVVELDEGVLGYGSVDQSNVTMDANGEGTMVYTAPPTLPINQHLQVRLSLSVRKTVTYPANRINTVTQFIIVKNAAVSQWHFVEIEGATAYACNVATNTTKIMVRATNEIGTGIASETLDISYSNPDVLFAQPSSVITNATGHGNFTIQFMGGIDTNATQIWIENMTAPNGVGGGITILYKRTTVPTDPVYGGVVTINQVPMMDPDSGDGLNFTIELYDLDGNPPAGTVPVSLVIGEPSQGPTAALENAPDHIYSSLWDWTGAQIFTDLDNGSISTGGYFLSDLHNDENISEINDGFYDSWQSLEDDYWTFVDRDNMKAVNVTGGTASFNITSDSIVLSDSIPSIIVAPMAKAGFYVMPDYGNFYWTLEGATAFKTDFVMERTDKMASVKCELDDGILRDFAPGNTSTGTVTVYDQDNNPITGIDVSGSVYAYGAGPFFSVDVAGATDVSGTTTFTVTGNTENTWGNSLSNVVRQPLYLEPDATGYANIFAATEIFNMPVQAYVTLEATPWVQEQTGASTVSLTAKVVDETGAAMSGVEVLFTADHGSLAAEKATSDVTGEATMTFTPSLAEGEAFAIFNISSSISVVGYGGGSATISVVSYNTSAISIPPAVYMSTPTGTGVPTDGVLTVVFNESMDESATEAAFNITPYASGSFAWYTMMVDVGGEMKPGFHMQFTPDSNLAWDTVYTVTINASVAKDVAGNLLDVNGNGVAEGSQVDDHTWSFTTEVEPLPPKVTGAAPTGGSEPIGTGISFTFSKEMNKASVEAGFSISPNVVGSFSWTGNTDVIFDSTSDLDYSSQYTIVLDANTVKDQDGLFLDGDGDDMAEGSPADDYEWGFTTEPPPPPPKVTDATPVGTSVIVGADIRVTFSNAMDQTSAETGFSITPLVAGVFSWSSNTLIFAPASALPYNTGYAIT
ncbi:MAG: Ig-like domain-containing protein, partial [Thermoplasmata archaeon]|nr:Ig-like domain-containing protein [Thermoplasmata archaeon]